MAHNHGGEAHAEDINCSAVGVEDYNQPLQIGGVFIVLGVSFLGALVPIAARSSKTFRVSDFAFMLFKCFGIGVIISTGLVHMMVPAFNAFRNPCLPEGWTGYGSWVAVFTLLGAFFVQLVQTIVLDHFSVIGSPEGDAGTMSPVMLENTDGATSSALPVPAVQRATSNHQHSHSHGTPEINSLAVVQTLHNTDGCATHQMVQNLRNHKHARITTFLLEFGVILHSVIIGLALGVTGGSEFIPLLVAISVHQFLEGFSVSTAAMDAGFKTLRTPIFLAVLFALTAPLGQSIGIGISSTFAGNSPTALITVGILDSLSAGILLYDGFVNLLTPTITHNHQFPKYTLSKKISIFVALWAGAAAMAIIGIWAQFGQPVFLSPQGGTVQQQPRLVQQPMLVQQQPVVAGGGQRVIYPQQLQPQLVAQPQPQFVQQQPVLVQAPPATQQRFVQQQFPQQQFPAEDEEVFTATSAPPAGNVVPQQQPTRQPAPLPSARQQPPVRSGSSKQQLLPVQIPPQQPQQPATPNAPAKAAPPPLQPPQTKQQPPQQPTGAAPPKPSTPPAPIPATKSPTDPHNHGQLATNQDALPPADAAAIAGHEGHDHGHGVAALACASGAVANYNLGLQIGGVFIILIVSAIGVVLPMASKYSKRFQMTEYAVLLSRLFGAGVILSTGFVHMLSHASENFTNPCSPENVRHFGALSGVLALLAIFIIQGLQTVASMRMQQRQRAKTVQEFKLEGGGSADAPRQSVHTMAEVTNITSATTEQPSPTPSHMSHGDRCAMGAAERIEASKNRLAAYMLEIGMVSHSVIVGVTLALTDGRALASLLIAVCFHQFFEALAIGSTLMNAGFKQAKTPILMAGAFVLATPLGQIIGIIAASSSGSQGPGSLVARGVFESLSAGILIYDGLMNVLAPLIANNPGFMSLSAKRKMGAFASMWLGALSMTLIMAGEHSSGGHNH